MSAYGNIPKPEYGNINKRPGLGARIKNIRHEIQQRPGQNDALHQKLTRLRVRRYQKHFDNPAVPSIKDAQYNTTVSGLRDTMNQTQASLLNQSLANEQEYGITDASNPYSRAALLQSSYKQAQARNLNSYAGAGQLYSGSYSNALAAGQTAYGGAQDALLRDYGAERAKLAQEGVQAGEEFTTGKNQALADALQRAVSAQPDPTMAPKPPQFVNRYLHHEIKQARKHKNKKRVQNLQDRLQGLNNG